MKESMNEKAFELILHAGNSRSSSMEALQYICSKDYKKADEKFEDAENELHSAHDVQTSLLFNNAQGATLQPDILMVHAQDHFTMASMCLDLCKEIGKLHKKIDDK